MRDRAKVLDIIAELQKMTVDRGYSPSEAAGAVAKIQEMLERHQLTLVDVQGQKLDEDMATEKVNTGRKACDRLSGLMGR